MFALCLFVSYIILGAASTAADMLHWWVEFNSCWHV